MTPPVKALLIAAVLRHLRHRYYCATNYGRTACTCGFRDALRALHELSKGGTDVGQR